MGNNNNREKKGVENEGRINHLVNLIEKSTRTQRHLEEHSDISNSPENIQHAKEIQEERKNQIENLKNIIAYGDNNSKDKHMKNTEKRFLYTEGYLNNNADRMDEETFKKAKEKQEHRKEQLDSYK
ncbi:MAG: hypothetical protein GX271_08165 [Clostridiales bacterium]|nr:hypothetical protein [Clostridiales bacterium]